MKITIACVGSLKEKYLREAEAEYIKRISRYAKTEVIEVKEVRLPAGESVSANKTVVQAEGAALLARLKGKAHLVALDICGKSFSSEKLAEYVAKQTVSGTAHIVFVIGGSLGLSKEVLDAADLRLSFSAMTFPHQLMRVILLEQLYRVFKINSGETYHK